MSGMSPEEVVELKNTLGNMAELLAAYYKELRDQGFDKGQALQLTLGWQRIVLGQQPKQDDD